jgi:DNA-binding CsgD family transcriptional regulator
MDAGLAEVMSEGRRALARGDWTVARARFEQAAQGTTSGEVLDCLAQARFSEADYAGAVDAAERACTAFRIEGAAAKAAQCARFVSYLYWVVHGDGAASSGWLARAVRLADAAGDCPERARIELTRATVTGDAAAREQHLAAALEIARRHGLDDLVLDAMSLRGLFLVAGGDVAAGMALLDEALAAVTAGEVEDLISVGAMYCKMLHACELTCDVRRAEEWLALADGFVRRTNRIPIGAICRTHYGGVLTAAGRWDDAEDQLSTAVQLYDRSYRALRAAAVVRLADVRIRQGRVEEASHLLVGADHDSYAIRPQVEVHLARDEADLAVARLERHLRRYPVGELTGPVLLLLTRARLAGGDSTGAATAAEDLADQAAQSSHPVIHVLAEYAVGLAAAARDDPRATGRLEAAVTGFGRLALPFEEARARLDLARVLGSQEPGLALVEARSALRLFQELGADREADAATSVLRALGVSGHTGPRGTGTLTGREEEVLALLGQGLSNPEIASRLFLSRRTVEHHVSNILAKLGLTTRAAATAFFHHRAGDV